MQQIESTLKNHQKSLIEEYGIKLIYVFGSYAKGESGPQSDLDIGVYLGRKENGFLKLALLDRLVDIFHREDIDLVILDTADEVLKFQVIKYGKPVYEESVSTRVLFEADTLSRYMDTAYFRKMQNKYSRLGFLKSLEKF